MALRHLDLQDVGIDQVFGGNAEPARGHLLDRRALRIAVGQRLEPLRLLAALAGVGLAADAVHCNGKGSVCLAADRAEAHCPGGKALDDVAGRFDLIERHRLVGEIEGHQSADRQQALALVVERRRKRAVFIQ
jgi:hypothetical protein